MNIWIVWKPTKNACLNWCACQLSYLTIPTFQLSDYLTILIFPTFHIQLSDLSNHYNWLSTHSTIPTFQPSNLSKCQTILTFHPFRLFNQSDFPTFRLFVFLTVRLSNYLSFQLSDSLTILPVWPFQPSTHSNFRTFQLFWLSNYPTIWPFQQLWLVY